MANELKYGVRITADGTLLINEAGKAEAALKKIGDEAKAASMAASRFGLAIGAAASLAAYTFGGLVKQSVSAAAALDDLSESTGSSVEQLSALTNNMAVSGVDFSTFSGLVNKLAVGLAGVDDEGGNAAKALAALGIQSKDPATAMRELAVTLDSYADGANKAALLTAIFGRGAAQYAGAFKDLARDIQLAGTVTTNFAAEAEQLEKHLARSKLEAQSMATAVASSLLPVFNNVIASFNAARDAGLSFWESLKMTGGYRPEDIAKQIGEVSTEVARLQKLIDSPNTGDSFVAKLSKDLDLAQRKLAALSSMQNANNAAIFGSLYPTTAKANAPTIGGSAAAAKKEIDQYLRGMGDIADALKHEDAERKKVNDGMRAQLELIDRLYEANARNVESVEKTIAGYQQQIDALTMTEDAILAKDRAKVQEIINAREYEGWMDKETEALKRQVAAMDALASARGMSAAAQTAKETAEAWNQTARGIGEDLTSAFLNAAESGRDFFKSLASDLYRMFSGLVLRPIIQGVMAPIAGGLTGMLGSGSAAASGLGGAGNLFGGGSNLLGYGGLSGLFSGAGGIFGAGAIGNSFALGGMGQALGLSAAGLDMGGGMALTTLGTTLGAAIPVIGAALAIASMAGVFSSKGGPKQGGTAGYSNWYPGETTASGNSAVQSVVAATEASFTALLAGLGGRGGAAFTLGYDTDPSGTADSRVSAGAMVNGQSVYSVRDLGVGRDEATLKTALELESKRAVLAALKASDLPAQIAAVFNSLAAETATTEQIDNLLSFGGAMKTVIDAISGSVIADAQAAWEQSQRTTVQVLADMGNEVVRLATEVDGSTASMQALASATGDYRYAVTQTLVAIKQIGKEVAEMFAGTRSSIEQIGLSPDDLYAYWTGKANSVMAAIGGATDPVEVQRLAGLVNSYLSSAMSALPEAQQLGLKNPMLSYLNEIDAFVQARLTTIGASISSSTEEPFAAANAALDASADKFGAAADVQADAAAILLQAAQIIADASALQLRAATTPITINARAASSEVNA